MSAGIKWRNLSVPQRKGLRQLCQAGTATVGWRSDQFSARLALALINHGAAVCAGASAAPSSTWCLHGKTIKPTPAGTAAVAAADAYLADPAAVARSRVTAPPATLADQYRQEAGKGAAVRARANSRTPAAVGGSAKRRTRAAT